MTSFYIFTSLFIFAKILSLASQNFSPGGQPMLFYGIFQQCPIDQVVTNSKLCQSAVQHANRDKNKFWKFILEKGKFKINNLMSENDFLYIHETFCSQDEAARIAINLKLNHSYFVKKSTNAEPKWNGKEIRNWNTTSRITYVMLFASTQFSTFFSEVFLGEKFIVTFLNEDFQLSSSFEDQNLYTSSKIFAMNTNTLMNNIDSEFNKGDKHYRRNQINYFGIIYIPSDSVILNIEFEMLNKKLLEKYKQFQKCFFVYKLNISDATEVNSLVDRIELDKKLKNLIVIGEPTNQTTLFRKYMKMFLARHDNTPTTSWIFYDLDKNSNFHYILYMPQYVFSFYNEDKKFTVTSHLHKLIAEIQTEFTTKRQYSTSDTALINSCNQAFGEHIIRMVQIIHLYEKFDYFKHYTFDRFKESCMRRFDKRKRGLRYMMKIKNTGVSTLANHYLHDEIVFVHYNFKCPVQHCGGGKQRFFGKIEQPGRRWNDSYGWSCVACPHNHFKSESSFDNTTCSPCPSWTLSTNDRSGCYDPYQLQYVKMTTAPILLLCISTCVLGFLLSSATIAVFFIFRATPFVKASDLQSSCLHLMIMLLFFASFPYLFVGKPDEMKCFIREIEVDGKAILDCGCYHSD